MRRTYSLCSLFVAGLLAGCGEDVRTIQTAKPVSSNTDQQNSTIQLKDESKPEKSDPQAAALVQAAIKAHTNNQPALLEKFKSVHLIREGQGVTGGVEAVRQKWDVYLSWPNRIRYRIDLPGDQFGILCQVGESAWQAGSVQAKQVMPPEQARNFGLDASAEWLWMLFPLLDPATVVTMAPDATLMGKPAVGVRVWSKGITDAILHFDKATNILMQITYDGRENGQRVIKEIQITSSKVYHGVTLGEKMTLRTRGNYLFDWTMTSMELMPTIDNKLFENP